MNQQIQPSFYSIIPADLRYDSRLKATEKLFFSEISALTNALGYCYAGNKYFSKLYDCDVRTISRWIQSLEKYGYIKVELIRDEKQVIKERRIYTRESMQGGIDNFVHTPMDRNVLDNNIYINNITHTTAEDISKTKYADKVYMTADEYQSLVNEYGELKAKKCIEELNIYKKSKGVEYPDDYSTIKRWVLDRVEEQEVRQNKKSQIRESKQKYKHYNQRDYPDEFWDSFYNNVNDIIRMYKKRKISMYKIVHIKYSKIHSFFCYTLKIQEVTKNEFERRNVMFDN